MYRQTASGHPRHPLNAGETKKGTAFILPGATPDNQELREQDSECLVPSPGPRSSRVFATLMDRWEGMGLWVPCAAPEHWVPTVGFEFLSVGC